jgi:hypothetical protein
VFKISPCLLSRQDKLVRWGILGFSVTPVVGAYFYNHGYKISFLVCPIRHFTGIPCPGCGMTKSFMAIARGDWSQAVTHNLFGPFLFTCFVLIVVHVSLELLTQRRVRAFYCQLLTSKKSLLLVLIVVLLYHTFRLYQLWQTQELHFAFVRSPLGQLLSLPLP